MITEDIIHKGVFTWENKVAAHTWLAYNDTQHKTHDYTSSPFSIYMGKMLEFIYYEHFKSVKRTCTEPNCELFGCDGGVDLTVDGIPVSVKLRSLKNSKISYLTDTNFLFNRQYDQAKNIIKQLISNNKKCKYIVGAIKYETSLFYDWMYHWKIHNNQCSAKLAEYAFEIFNNNCLWFSTEHENVRIY